MRLQQLPYSCGPAAIANGARLLGYPVHERVVRKASNCDHEGAGPSQLITAIRELGFSASTYETTDRHDAWRWLHGVLLQGSVPILCVDSWGHWVTVVGMLGREIVLLFDPQRTRRNLREHGVQPLPKEKLMRRWIHASKPKKFPMYAICMSKP